MAGAKSVGGFSDMISFSPNGLKSGLETIGIMAKVKPVLDYVTEHFHLILKIVLIVYAALAIYEAFFMSSPNPFMQDNDGFHEVKHNIIGLARMGVVILGLYAEFMGSRLALRLFICFLCIDGVCTLVAILVSHPSGLILLKENQAIDDMWKAQKSYSWSPFEKQADDSGDGLAPNPREIAHSTLAWDEIQEYGCCGVDNFRDWDRVRPSDFPADTYPSSCCDAANITVEGKPSVKLCDKTAVYPIGCRKQLNLIEGQRQKLLFCIALIEIALAILYFYKDMRQDPDQPSRSLLMANDNLNRLQQEMKSPHNQPIMPVIAPAQPPKYGATGPDNDTKIVGEDEKYNSNQKYFYYH